MFRILEQLKKWLSQSSQINENQNIKSKTENQVIESKIIKLENEEITSNAKIENINPPINTQSDSNSTNSLQEQLNNLSNDSTLSLWPAKGEYTGPIIINHSLVLDGKGATIWANQGPVLSIISDQVTIRNLRIEVTGEIEFGNSKNNCAILVKSGKNLNFENIEVRGSVMGLSEEEGEWQYPSVLNIGRIAHGQEYNFRWRIIVPVNCEIVSEISGIEFNQRKLNPGKNEINVHIEKLPQDTLINGSIYLVSANLKRRISLTAHIVSLAASDTSAIDNDVIWEAESWSSFLEVTAKDDLNYVSEKETVAEKKIIINQSKEASQPIPPNDSVSIEKNDEFVTKSRTYREVIPNPIFAVEAENINQQKTQQSKIENTSSSNNSTPINPIFQKLNINQSEIKNDNSTATSAENNSSTINPIFQKHTHVSKPVNSDQSNEESSSQPSDSKTNPQGKKRTQAIPNNIFMGDNKKKEEPKE